jgi:hypothetical protein
MNMRHQKIICKNDERENYYGSKIIKMLSDFLCHRLPSERARETCASGDKERERESDIHVENRKK